MGVGQDRLRLWTRMVQVTDFWKLVVAVRLVIDDNTPWSDWIVEQAIVREPGPNILRLSGVGIRNAVYIRYCAR